MISPLENPCLPKKEKIPFKLVGPSSAPRRVDSPTTPILKKEKKEKIEEAEFKVIFDKEKFSKIMPEQILKDSKFLLEEPGERENKIKELGYVKNVMMRLPEQLEFKPGITIIVGENGSGKSTLAKALFYSHRIEREKANNYMNESDEKIKERILKPPANSGEIIDIKASGLASYIAEAISVTAHEADKGTESPKYIDYAKEAGRLSDLYNQLSFDSMGRSNTSTINYVKESNRQAVDKHVTEQILREKEWAKGAQINFFDEPEVGISPRRHMNLLEEVKNFSTENSIVIIPTNSPILFSNPEIPRIDLDYPERGIFCPKDYPEDNINKTG